MPRRYSLGVFGVPPVDVTGWRLHSRCRRPSPRISRGKKGRDPMSRHWDVGELARARQMHADGVAMWEIADKLGRSRFAVETKLLLKVKRSRTSARNWSESELATARRMRVDGASLDEIGQCLGRSPHAVAVKLSRTKAGRLRNEPGPIANASGKAMACVLRRRGWVCLPPAERRRLEGLKCSDPTGCGDSCAWASPERRINVRPLDALGGVMSL